jgi:hypothetical protein
VLRHVIFDKKPEEKKKEDVFDEDWVLFEAKTPSVIVEQIDFLNVCKTQL